MYKSWLLGRLGVTQGHRQCHHSIERIRLPVRLNRNRASILYRFRDVASSSSKVADYNPPHLHSAPQGVTPVEFRGDLWRQKTRSSGLSCGFICVILCLACLQPISCVLVEHRLVIDRHRHRATAYTALAQRRAVKTVTYLYSTVRS